MSHFFLELFDLKDFASVNNSKMTLKSLHFLGVQTKDIVVAISSQDSTNSIVIQGRFNRQYGVWFLYLLYQVSQEKVPTFQNS